MSAGVVVLVGLILLLTLYLWVWMVRMKWATIWWDLQFHFAYPDAGHDDDDDDDGD